MLSKIKILAILFVLFIVPLGLFLNTPYAQAETCTTDSRNLIQNGSFVDGRSTQYGSVGAGWEPFIYAGSPPHFALVDNENGRGDIESFSQHIHGAVEFDAGIYQVVRNLQPGTQYQFSVGFALVARDKGTGRNERVDEIGRQIGVDPFGDTDAHSPRVIWGPKNWDGNPALDLESMRGTFGAQADHVTVYVRAFNRNPGADDKVWLDKMCLFARPDLPSVTLAAPPPTDTPPATNTRAATNTPRPTAVPTETATLTVTPTSTSTPTPTSTRTETPRPRRVIPTVSASELSGSAINLDSSQILGGIGIFAVGGAVVMLMAGVLVWFMRR